MRIKLNRDLPVSDKHGMRKGRVLKVVRYGRGRSMPHWYVMGDAGEEVGVLKHEADLVRAWKGL